MPTTRFYVSNDAPAVSPPFTTAGWTSTGSAIRRNLDPSKTSAATTESPAVAGATSGARTDYMIVQGVSAPLDSNQTISGNIKGQFRTLINNVAAKAVSQVYIWVWTGASNRGTLLNFNTTDASEWSTTAVNRQMPRGGSLPLSSVSAQTGDRIVIEIGWSKFENAATSRTGTIRLGNYIGTDLPEDQTDTDTTKVSWLEFDSAITFTTNARVTQQTVRAAVVPSSANALVTQQTLRIPMTGPTVTQYPPLSTSSSFTANAVIKKRQSASFTADAAINLRTSGSFTADAIVKKMRAGSFSADAVIRGSARPRVQAVFIG